jgi:hypothetical protein
MYKIASAVALVSLPLTAFAHPGAHHMSIGAMVAHFASEPFHLGMLLLVIVGGFALAAKLSRKD